MLANDAGTGKTYVLGGIIREMLQRGQKNIVYVTTSQDLMDQAKENLKAYGINKVKVVTYAKIRKDPVDTTDAVLIFDESQNVKNMKSLQGKSAAKMMKDARFVVTASATPYENPVQAGYLEPTGIFKEVGGHHEWAVMYGATEVESMYFDYAAGQEVVTKSLRWDGGGKSRRKDLLDAREWMRKQGVFTQRTKRLPKGFVNTEFIKKTVDQKYVDLINKLGSVFEDAVTVAEEAKDYMQAGMIKAYSVNTFRRVLEAAKVQIVIDDAKRLAKEGKQVVIFTATKADRHLGKFRRSDGKSKILYTYPQMVAEMDKHNRTNTQGAYKKKPFSDMIMFIAKAMHDNQIDFVLPSVIDEYVKALGKSNVALYTGNQTTSQARKNKDGWLRNEKTFLVSTMDKGGTGLSLHDTTGKMPARAQVGGILPWNATQIEQTSGRLARYGVAKPVDIKWVFADNVPFDKELAARVGKRMSDMGALVKGVELGSAEALESFDFEDGFDASKMKAAPVSAPATEEEDLYRRAAGMEKGRKKASDTSGDFFATPYTLAVFMAQAAGIKPTDTLLEPSAGEGNLIKLLPVRPARIDAVEQRQDNANKLSRIPDVDIHNEDFMEWEPGIDYDVILMNPPFSRLKGEGWQDVNHIQRAYGMLASGGRLVAIQGEGSFFREDKQSAVYRQWLEDNGAQVVKLPENIFKKSGTGVRARMVIIDKDADPGISHIELESAEVESLQELEDAIVSREDQQGSKTFTPDPTVDEQAEGKAGFAGIASQRPGGKVPKPYLTDKRVESPDPDIKALFARTEKMPTGLKLGKLYDKLHEGLRERFIFTHHLLDTPEAALARDMIRTMPEQQRAAIEQAVRDIIELLNNDGTVQALDRAGLNLLRHKVFAQDLLLEAQMDRSNAGDISVEQWELENIRLDAEIDAVPSVKKAYEARQRLWRMVSQDLYERGVINEEARDNQAYVRHFVLSYIENNRKPLASGKKRKLSEPFRVSSLGRKGHKGDISTDYLQVEVQALADIYADNVIEDIANEIGDHYNRRKEFKGIADKRNFVNLVGGQDNVNRIQWLRAMIKDSQEGPDRNESDMRLQRKSWIMELTDLDPTYPYRKRIAIHMSKLQEDEYYDDEGSIDFKWLAKLAKNQPDTSMGMAARGIFKAISERNKMIKDALGKDYVTPVQVAAENGYVEWHYKRPNLFYMAQTLPEAKVAALVENIAEEAGEMLHISKSELRSALVLGRRDGMLIPEWLARQLDDLPINKHSGMIVESFTKPFIQYWKRWILRVNALRYNWRNQIGDVERLNASGQSAAIARIPEAVKLLVLKEGENYDRAVEFGVVGSSLWHEMNDVKKLKEFEKFKKYSKKSFAKVVKNVFGSPIRLVSKVGQIEQDLTQFREDILRMAVYLHNIDKLKRGDKLRHWAGKLADVEAIARTSKPRAAAKVARETLIDYGDFTPWENNVLRNGLLPFYSFLKRNLTFWPRALKNAALEGEAGRGLMAVGVAAGRNIAKWLVRILWIYAAAYLWNHKDEKSKKQEKSLAFWQRSTPHVNLPGMTLWGQTALADFGEWFDMESLSSVAWRYEAGFLTPKEAAIEASKKIAQAPVNRLFQALNPFIKAPGTAITGQQAYPSIFDPYFVAAPASKKSFEMAVLGILGGDAKKFYQSAKGERKFEDTLYAYFAGWWGRPSDPETLAEEIKKQRAWSSLKNKSQTSGRRRGAAKSGKEESWQESVIRQRALKGQK